MKTIEEILLKLVLAFTEITPDLQDFMDCEASYEAKAEIENLILEEVRKTEKAFGGCKKCYGKGYSTTWSGLTGANDFTDSDGFVTPPKNHMNFCTCDRGKQLNELQSTKDMDGGE